jgi:glycosyltransferase involved in cell wall biosynthesis
MSDVAPTLAVVTPSYNTGRFIGPAVASVLEQDYPCDYIVMDGGSTDQTLDVLRGFGDRLTWFSQRDGGQTDAINQGFARAHGEILGWLNSDDTYEPGAFAAVAKYFAANPDVALVYGDANYIDAEGKFISRCMHVESFDANRLNYYTDFIVQPAAFFRRSALEAVGGLDASIHYAMDYDLWLKIAKRFRVAYMPTVLANFRWLRDNKTATGGFRRLDEIRGILARQGFPEPAYIRLERVNLHMHAAKSALSHGKIGQSLKHTAQAAGTLLRSGRAIKSIFSPHTWRIIWTGQILRARAAKEKT